MLRNKKKKTKVKTRRVSTDKSPKTSSSKKSSVAKAPSWAYTRKDDMDKASDEYDAQKGLIRFRPELRIKDKETKTLRFMSDEPLCMLFFYNIRYKGRWHKFTRPLEDEDILETELERSPVPYFIWEVFDPEGYIKNNGERVENICRYWVVPKSLNSRIEGIAERCGPLSNYMLDVKRTGEGTDTQYDFFPSSPSRMPKAALKSKRLNNRWAEFYEPPTIEQQEQIIRHLQKGA